MRIWSLHPQYLDKKALIESWNDGLQALGMLGNDLEQTFHPDLSRFRRQGEPQAAIHHYLSHIAKEADRRGYKLDTSKLPDILTPFEFKIPVSSKQLEYEWKQLMHLLADRSPKFMKRIENSMSHEPNPLFVSRPGSDIEAWEMLS